MRKSRALSKTHRFVGVTFGELAAWHASGETTLLRSRLVDVPQDSNAPTLPVRHGYAARMLLRRLPPLSLDDEEGVLIVRLAYGQLPGDDEDLQLVRIPMEWVEGVMPVTARAQEILVGRLEPYGIAPGEAWFEDEFRALSYERRVESSTRAGSDLVTIFAPGLHQLPTEELKDSAALALALKDFDGAVPGDAGLASISKTWVPYAFGWTRHKPYDRGALNHLYDAGTILKEMLQEGQVAVGRTDALAGFRDSIKLMKHKFGDDARIDEILGCEEFDSVAQALQEATPNIFPAGLCALVLYLRWQEQFHKADSSIDIGGLSADLQRLAWSIDNHTDILAALWLLGFYAGCERIEPLAYAADHDRYPWFRGQPLEVERLQIGIKRVDAAPLGKGHTHRPAVPVAAETGASTGSAGSADSGIELSVVEAELQSESRVAEGAPPNAAFGGSSESPTDECCNLESKEPRKPSADERSSSVHADGAEAEDEDAPAHATVVAGHSAADEQACAGDTVDNHPGFKKTSRELFGQPELSECANQDTPKYGKRPWERHRTDQDAIQIALVQARQLHPDLQDRDLYQRVAKEWFGYTSPRSKWLELIESIDHRVAARVTQAGD